MRRLLVLVMAFLAAGIGARAAHACSCAPPPSLREAVDEADVAFSGTVVKRLGGNRYEVEVDGVLTGAVASRVTLTAEDPRTSTCGTELTAGPIVYTGGRDLRVSSCSWVWRGGEAATVLAASGLVRGAPTAAPDPSPAVDGSPERLGAAAAGVVIAAGVVAYALRRRRSAAASAGGTASAG